MSDQPSAAPGAVLPEESLAELYDQAPCGYLTTTADGEIVRVNDRILLGLTEAQLFGLLSIIAGVMLIAVDRRQRTPEPAAALPVEPARV